MNDVTAKLTPPKKKKKKKRCLSGYNLLYVKISIGHSRDKPSVCCLMGCLAKVKIRFITFRAMGGPRPGVFNHLFAKDSFEKLEKNHENFTKMCHDLGKNLYPLGFQVKRSWSLLSLQGLQDFHGKFIICVCCAFLNSLFGH